MKNFKKVIAFLCSATLVLGSSVTAFATDPSSEAGTGNIIAYSVETVTVPTAIKVSFNPQKWDFYIDGTNKVNSQIVSLNYGIASLASTDKRVTVKFAATGTKADTGEDIVFVDNADAVTNADYGEYKMYLAVAPASAKVTASRGDNPTTFAFDANAVTTNITGALLADVGMSAATKGLQAFEAGSTNIADASISYKLTKAVYEMKEGSKPDWTTTNTTLAGMMKGKTLGDIVGFTLTGSMNEKVDWTKANLAAIAITPTYKIEDVDGTETAVADGGYAQVTIGAAAAAALPLELVTATGNLRYTFPESARPTGSLTAVTVNGVSRAGAISAGNIFYKADNGNFIITKTAVDNADIGIVQGGTTVVATIGGTEYTFTY